MTMVIIVNSAQSNRIEMMLKDDFKSNGIGYLFKLKSIVNDMLLDGINDVIKNRYYDEITLVSDVKLTELFSNLDVESFCLLQSLINYIKVTYNAKEVTAGYLLCIDYSELISSGVINLDTIQIITSELDILKEKRENIKQKTKQFA